MAMGKWRLAAAGLALTGLAPAQAQDKAPLTYWGTETADAAALARQYEPKKGTMGVAQHAMVAACHDASVAIGIDILRRGGSAADAFIAVTFADYVQAPGTSSIGGPMGAIVYDAKTKQVATLLAPLKAVRSPTGQWTAGEQAAGKQVMVPGAVAGLQALHKRYGRLPWAELVRPAARLARTGFTVNWLYAGVVRGFASAAGASDYGRKTFFHADGSPLAIGETLKLPVLAETLDGIAAHGAAFLRRGRWAKEAVEAVHAKGGEMVAADLAGYRAEWAPAIDTEYRGFTVYALGGKDNGGARLLLGLETLAHADIARIGHYSESLDGLETMVRVSRAVGAEATLYDHATFDRPGAIETLLDGRRAGQLWDQVIARRAPGEATPTGTHSYSVAVVDAEGNAIAGTHTIESLPFGSGIFVGGVPLNNAGLQHPYVAGAPGSTPPGADLIEPLSAVLAFEQGRLVLASSTFSASLWPADLELVSSILDFDWSPGRVALTPRFGGPNVDLVKLTADISTTMLDKRYSPELVSRMKARGLSFTQAGYIDTGMLVMIKQDRKTRELSGFTPEQLPEGRAGGY